MLLPSFKSRFRGWSWQRMRRDDIQHRAFQACPTTSGRDPNLHYLAHVWSHRSPVALIAEIRRSERARISPHTINPLVREFASIRSSTLTMRMPVASTKTGVAEGG
jgi:hypothetical protein